ncbi:dienelactone hydrolase endo-1,3,1,4-beta-D-glucanase [Vararia minispora EC-137]|uniref:Dienelactone hydrolase endo-1,3,1,4-beta-D-glucanase n=1 Tax=Vararia minispora EC-137 TaxID=1314806 RepID=A0ACB8QF21_9AGAM|nr:dienelactone hydrolase endo-1,3,1,4-beta-D-glucanase [Vararia minispora EC-137]
MSCENCFKGSELPGTPTGTMVGDAYFAASPAGEAASEDQKKTAVVLLTDVFGLPMKNCKILADILAQRLDVDVWVPDVFDGRPLAKVEELEPLMPDRAGVAISFLARIRFFFLALFRLHIIYAIRPAVGAERAKKFITMLREEKGYEKVGAVGYCYGGILCVMLGSTDILDTVVIAHPGTVSLEQIKAMKIPASWACAEEDMSFKPRLRQEAQAIFAARKEKPEFVDYEFRDYKGPCTAHGFAIRPNQSYPEVKAGYEGALEQTVTWFKTKLSL